MTKFAKYGLVVYFGKLKIVAHLSHPPVHFSGKTNNKMKYLLRSSFQQALMGHFSRDINGCSPHGGVLWFIAFNKEETECCSLVSW